MTDVHQPVGQGQSCEINKRQKLEEPSPTNRSSIPDAVHVGNEATSCLTIQVPASKDVKQEDTDVGGYKGSSKRAFESSGNDNSTAKNLKTEDSSGSSNNEDEGLLKFTDDDDDSGPAPVIASKVGISCFNDYDVLSGRGGGTNVHPGNRNFRDLINLHRRAYLKARKNDKPAISRAIVRSIRENNGRFLKKDEKANMWYEIGDDAAREKTSQALRQRAPEMRKLLFDTEREEARAAAADEQMRQQQRMMMVGTGAPSASTHGGQVMMQPPGMPPPPPGMMTMPFHHPYHGMPPMGQPMFVSPNPAMFQAAGIPNANNNMKGNNLGMQGMMQPNNNMTNMGMLMQQNGDPYYSQMFSAALLGGHPGMNQFVPTAAPPQQQNGVIQ